MKHSLCTLDVIFVGVIDANLDLSVPALLEGFEMRESISFIEEHINRQVRLSAQPQYEQVQQQ